MSGIGWPYCKNIYLMSYTLFALFLGMSTLRHFKRRSEITPFLIALCLVMHIF